MGRGGASLAAAVSADACAKLLARSFLFRGLARDVLARIGEISTLKRIAAKDTLFWEGDEADALYGVIEGMVRIWLHGPDGKELTLSLMEPGDFFGEIALLDGLRRTASASAFSDSELIVVPRRDFLALLETEPRLSLHIVELLCERLRSSTDRIRDATFLDLGTRLCKTLRALAIGHGRDEPGGTVIEAKLSQSMLAQFLGASREAVNKQLKLLERDGVIGRAGNLIKICDANALAERAHPPE
ncbi:MAG: Crp/Fnr family transcriptional regulator [Pseudomonadota bacterium]